MKPLALIGLMFLIGCGTASKEESTATDSLAVDTTAAIASNQTAPEPEAIDEGPEDTPMPAKVECGEAPDWAAAAIGEPFEVPEDLEGADTLVDPKETDYFNILARKGFVNKETPVQLITEHFIDASNLDAPRSL